MPLSSEVINVMTYLYFAILLKKKFNKFPALKKKTCCHLQNDEILLMVCLGYMYQLKFTALVKVPVLKIAS